MAREFDLTIFSSDPILNNLTSAQIESMIPLVRHLDPPTLERIKAASQKLNEQIKELKRKHPGINAKWNGEFPDIKGIPDEISRAINQKNPRARNKFFDKQLPPRKPQLWGPGRNKTRKQFFEWAMCEVRNYKLKKKPSRPLSKYEKANIAFTNAENKRETENIF